MDDLSGFDPAIQAWFKDRFGRPTAVQASRTDAFMDFTSSGAAPPAVQPMPCLATLVKQRGAVPPKASGTASSAP